LNDGNGGDSGHVRIYQYDVNKTTNVTDQNSSDFGPVGWRRLGQDINGRISTGYYGASVSLSANGTIVGVGGFLTNTGYVRILQYANSTWTQIGQDINGAVSGDQFGVSVSLSANGTTIACGAPTHDSSRGHVRVYQIGEINTNELPSLDQSTVSSVTDSVPTNVTPDANTGVIDITIDPTILTTGTETEKSQKRQIFLERLFTNNTGLASSPNKIKMTKEELLGTNSTIPKANLVIKKADNTNTPVTLDDLSQDEGVYVYMGSGDFTVFNTSAGLLKILKRTDRTYDIYENYVDSTSSVTKQMIIGESSSFGTFNYTIGSVTGYTGGGAPVPICFPKGTPVNTDQGNIDIEKLNPDIHTIRGKKIVAITQTTLSSRVKHIVSIERGAFGLNTPSATTHISKDHKLLYNDNLVAAKDLVDICEGVTLIPYYGEILYNVLMQQQDYMVINNLLCETLNPNHIMAIICGGKYDNTEQNLLCEKLSTIITNNDLDGYTDLCKQLHRTPFQ